MSSVVSRIPGRFTSTRWGKRLSNSPVANLLNKGSTRVVCGNAKRVSLAGARGPGGRDIHCEGAVAWAECAVEAAPGQGHLAHHAQPGAHAVGQVYSLSPSAIGACYGYILSPLLRLVARRSLRGGGGRVNRKRLITAPLND
eukprot:1189950-Prorocentrum_minimum.AAC.1